MKFDKYDIFTGCSALKTVTFPSTALCVEIRFSGCKNLSAIYIKVSDNIYWIALNKIQDHADDLKIYVPTGKVDEYKQKGDCSNFKDRIVGYDFN